jgi:hypothetical protein
MRKYTTLTAIQRGLVRGDIARISRKTGYDLSHVYRVIMDEVPANLVILNEAARLLEEREVLQSSLNRL